MADGGSKTEKQFEATGFFRIEKDEERWRIIDPSGRNFISIGLNHAEETNLKYPHNFDIWKEKYGSREKWIASGVVADLQQWGFNTIGWTQDWMTSELRHGRGWTRRDFEIADMPYCVVLPIAEIEEYNAHPFYPDVFSREFDEYCDYLARSICVDHAEDKNLLGYFLADVPAWGGHRTGACFPEHNSNLGDIAAKYYETACGYIRKYDPNHLIFGDRYNGNSGVNEEALEAMKPFVDVLSVQYLGACENIVSDMRKWQAACDKPALLADFGCRCPTHFRPSAHDKGIVTQADRADLYIRILTQLLQEPWFVGWHWCSYIENPARSNGIKDPWDNPHRDFLGPVGDFNREVSRM
ncbi:agarase [Candidatus Hydrogenedentota bacterium]